MGKAEFINKLIEALDEKAVREKINEITQIENDLNSSCNKGDCNELKYKISELEHHNYDLKEKIKDYEEKLKLAEKNIENCEIEKEQLNKKLYNDEIKINILIDESKELNEQLYIKSDEIKCKNSEIYELNKKEKKVFQELEQYLQVNKYYENTFSEMLKKYKCYLSLRENIKLELKSVINGESIELFMVSGSQWGNIEALWQFISYKINEYENLEILNLIEVFEYFFSKYNEIHNMYERLQVNIGEEFDEDLHSRGADSRVSGEISEVELLGYKNIRTDKIIQKSIVRVL